MADPSPRVWVQFFSELSAFLVTCGRQYGVANEHYTEYTIERLSLCSQSIQSLIGPIRTSSRCLHQGGWRSLSYNFCKHWKMFFICGQSILTLKIMERQMRQKSENRLANSENRLLCLQNRLANSENQLSCLQNRLANSENRLSCLQNRLSCLQNRLPNSIIVFGKSFCRVCKIDYRIQLSCLQNRLERRMRQKSENRLANSENRSSCCQN